MPVKIFFCYARKDEDETLLNKLKTHLIPLQRQGLIDLWYDRDILAGANWEEEIKKQLNEAHIILLLVSPDFMASDYCYGDEMKLALERYAKGECMVIPIILRPVYWHGEPLGKLQALPTDGKPITNWQNQDSAFYDVVVGLYKVIEELAPRLSPLLPVANAPQNVQLPLQPQPALYSITATPTRPLSATSLGKLMMAGKLSLISSKVFNRHNFWPMTHISIIVAMGAILFLGIFPKLSVFSSPRSDAALYQCYAVTFWNGAKGLSSLPNSQCPLLELLFFNRASSQVSSSELPSEIPGGEAPSQRSNTHSTCSECSSSQQGSPQEFPPGLFGQVKLPSTLQPFHTLPLEYPFLTVFLFSLTLVGPLSWYPVVFALCMAFIAGVTYALLLRYRSIWAAIAFALYIVVGSWATAEGRFDLVPSAFTLGALILAQRSRWNWAFSLLALASLLKFYPLFLVIPFLICQQKQYTGKWYSWQRWKALSVFISICSLVTIVSLVLSVTGTVNPVLYLVNRPDQVESFQGSLLWLANFIGFHTTYVISYGSLNFLSFLTPLIAVLSMICLIAVLSYISWLQWRETIDLSMSSLLILLAVLVTSKVFSSQYLLWVSPLVAYRGMCNWKWLVSWGSIALLTTAIYPFLYENSDYIQRYYLVILTRNVLFLVMLCILLSRATWSWMNSRQG